ncbi:MAG: hypothetical protein MJE77_21500 [Proteobacteria bacterium]|nr:hypothetical protein [Pseudomonadota bacterium]
MNSSVFAAVEWWLYRSSHCTALAVAVALIPCAACVEVKGAAAEFSWSIRTFSGQPVASCSEARINSVHLRWNTDASQSDPEPDDCTPDTRCVAFKCSANRGVTDFVIDEGRQLLWIEPICDDARRPDAATFTVPPPIAREVSNGEVVTLNSLLIVAQTTGCSSATSCTCMRDGTGQNSAKFAP